MTRLHVVVEGQTEEVFVNTVLVEHLAPMGVFVDARCVETSRSRVKINRGGLPDFKRAHGDVLRWMKEDQNPDAHFTTMFDLFRLPANFPNFDEAKRMVDPVDRVACLERGLGEAFGHQEFTPYIQLHEFEALLLSHPERFVSAFPHRGNEVRNLATITAGFTSPELINDGAETAPSKRVIREIPEYAHRKASAGPLIASKIGLVVMREKCPHFNAWLERIEGLSGQRGA